MANKKIKNKKKSKHIPIPKTKGYRYIVRVLRKYAGVRWLAENNPTKAARDIAVDLQGRPATVRNILDLVRGKKNVPIPPKFDNWIKYYSFVDTIVHPIYNNVQISVTVDIEDGTNIFNFKGDKFEVSKYYKLNLSKYLRAFDKDYPSFVITKTDNKTFVDYHIELERTVSERKEPPVTKEPTIEKPVDKETEKKIELEKEQQKTLQKRIDLASKAIELRKEGFSPKEILKILGI